MRTKYNEPYVNQFFPKFSSSDEIVAFPDSIVEAYLADVEEVVK